MSRPVLIDTDVLVDFFRGNRKAEKLIQKHQDRIIFSSIVVSELYAGVKGPRELSILDEIITQYRVIPVSAQIARSAGILKNEYGRSHGVGLPDAIIAASALAEDAALLTLNVKHYPMLKGLKPAYVKRS